MNSVNFLNFKSQVNQYRPKIVYSSQPLSGFSVKASKIAPLSRDTVSFKGGTNEAYISALDNLDICHEVSLNAQEVNKIFVEILNKYFVGEDEATRQRNKAILSLKARVKSGYSIAEKVAEKISGKFNDKKYYDKPEVTVFPPKSPVGIKENIRDISGARIVVKDSNSDSMDVVIDNLCKMIISENLVIAEIENNVSPDKSAKPYFNSKQLKKLLDAANQARRKNGLSEIDLKTKITDYGYMALHIIVDTRNKPQLVKNQGYWSEIQVLGRDVEVLKDIEDFCYKLKKGMSIKSKDVAYRAIGDMFSAAYNDMTRPNVRKNFRLYTIEAYKRQRNRIPTQDVTDDTTNWAYKLPTIEECGFKGKLPYVLDFNLLARILRDCDDLFHVEYNGQEILDAMNKTNNS